MVRKKKNLFIKTKLYFLNKGLQWKLLFAIFVTIIAMIISLFFIIFLNLYRMNSLSDSYQSNIELDYFCEGENQAKKFAKAVNFIKDAIETHHKAMIRQKNYLTDHEFRVKMQELMHPDDGSYLFVDPISCDQANLWFYERFKQKIESHPHIWKWFFEL